MLIFFTPATPRIDRLLTFVQILPCEIRVCVKKIKINESICKDSIVKSEKEWEEENVFDAYGFLNKLQRLPWWSSSRNETHFKRMICLWLSSYIRTPNKISISSKYLILRLCPAYKIKLWQNLLAYCSSLCVTKEKTVGRPF